MASAAETTAAKTVKIGAFGGSLRKASANLGLLRAAVEMGTEGAEITLIDISELPLYNGDIEAAGPPESVTKFWEALKACNAFLIATPEFNFGMAANVKNAIDWASRCSDKPLAGRPLGIMSAGGGHGGLRAQMSVRQTMVFLDMHVLNSPAVAVRIFAGKKFDDSGNLIDDDEKKKVAAMLAALTTFTAKFL